MRSLVAGEPSSYDAIDNCQKGMPDGCLVQGTLASVVSHISHSPDRRSRSDRLPEEPAEDDAEPVPGGGGARLYGRCRSEEHTAELQSLMRNSYAVCCLKKTITKSTPEI